MKVKEALISDYRKEEVKSFIQEKLKQIPVFKEISPGEDVPIDLLEVLIWKLSDKYGVTMQYIMPSHQRYGKRYYTCSFKTSDDHKWIGTVSGLSIYEIYAKGALMLYSYTRKQSKDIQ